MVARAVSSNTMQDGLTDVFLTAWPLKKFELLVESKKLQHLEESEVTDNNTK